MATTLGIDLRRRLHRSIVSIALPLKVPRADIVSPRCAGTHERIHETRFWAVCVGDRFADRPISVDIS
jgi:hypothetical protein